MKKIQPTMAQTHFSAKSAIPLTVTVYSVYEHSQFHLAMAGFFIGEFQKLYIGGYFMWFL
jgi:hypothetical protein